MKFKGQIKSKNHIQVKNRDYGIRSKKVDVAKGKPLRVKKKKARLIRQGASTLRKAVIATSIKSAEDSEKDESTENAKLTMGKAYHTQQGARRYMKEVGKNYQRQRQKQELEKLKKNGENKQAKRAKKQPQSKKQRERELAVKKSRERHKGKIIDRKKKAPIKDIQKSKQLVKAKHGKAIKGRTAKTAKKVVGKKAGVQLTAGTVKGLKTKAVLLKIGSAVASGAKAIASFVALKFLIPIGIIGIALILIVAILVAIVGFTASIDPAIPIAEEALVTEIHVHLTELDIDWNDANGTSIRTNSSDVIALVFMGGGIDPERENNEAILAEVTTFHQELHENGSGDVVSFLRSHPLLETTADSFVEFREIAFFHFYGTLGDPYVRASRDYVTSHFGWRPCPFGSGDREMHHGIDIAWLGMGNVPVRATISGRIERVAYDDGGYGIWVMIVNDDDPDNRKETRYAHLHSTSVSMGQRVGVGDVVGLTGTTGSSTGDHLHHEFRRNGNLLNPYFYFPNENLEMGIGGGD